MFSISFYYRNGRTKLDIVNFSAWNYDIINALEKFGNDLKQLKENT